MTTPRPPSTFSAQALWPWALLAVLMAVAPLFARSSFSLSLLSQMGIAIVACLSYNILLGQGGMLSFGHAVYTGLASFMTVHALNRIADGSLPVPTSLVPLIGGLTGAAFAVVLGFVTTRKAGTPFAMITLGIGELVFAMSLMVPEFFGGEGGVSANRAGGPARLGITFGPPIQVYVLIAVYTFVCTAAMYAFTRTPLGRILNAVRDNPERVEFIGYSTSQVRFLAFVIAGFFAGVSGGMYSINFEIATAEVVGAARSGAYLLFTFLGGAVFFFGPIIGGVLMVLATVLLSEFTKAWLLYLGIIFLFMVIRVPGGIASLVMMNARLAAFGQLKPLLPLYAGLAVTGTVALLGIAAVIEMVYHLQLKDTLGHTVPFLGVTLDVRGVSTWAGALALIAVGVALFAPLRSRLAQRWAQAQEAIEAEIRSREAQA